MGWNSILSIFFETTDSHTDGSALMFPPLESRLSPGTESMRLNTTGLLGVILHMFDRVMLHVCLRLLPPQLASLS